MDDLKEWWGFLGRLVLRSIFILPFGIWAVMRTINCLVAHKIIPSNGESWEDIVKTSPYHKALILMGLWRGYKHSDTEWCPKCGREIIKIDDF